MQKLVIFFAFFLTSSVLSAQQNEDLYNTSRLFLYGENPIGSIIQITDDALYSLQDYAMKSTDPATIKQLNDDDAWLLSMLCFIEDNRRVMKTNNEFLVYLQGRTEWLKTQPLNGRTGRAEGWVQAYELLIRTGKLSVGR